MSNINEKPVCKLIGEDGNVFNIIVKVSQALKKAGLNDQAREFQDRAVQQESYHAVLSLIMEYVDVE